MPLSDPLRIANIYAATASGAPIYGVKECTISASRENKTFASDDNLGATFGANTTISATGKLILGDEGSPHLLCDGVVKYMVLTWKGNDGIANKTTIGVAGAPPVPPTGMLFTGWSLRADHNDSSGSGFTWELDFILVFGYAATTLGSLIVNTTA